MKRKIILTTIVSLFLAAAVSAQTATNYAGVWELDAGKSKLPATMQVESMTLKVTQTDTELTVESTSKGAAKRGGTTSVVYNLEGKESVKEAGSGMMASKETRRAAFTADGKLNLNFTRSFKSETGDVNLKTNEIWELLDEGKTMKVTRYMETPRGATNAEMYFTGKPSKDSVQMTGGYRGSVSSVATTGNDAREMPKKISGGVLNGKAASLPKPAYPAAARAVGASGAVNVQVTINEQGDVVSASAVSGHPLLRQAAEQAARAAKFAPTILSGVPVSVTGILVYNFVP